MNNPSHRERATLIGAAGLAIATPLLLLWPTHPDVRQTVLPIATVVPAVHFALSGAATEMPLFSPTRLPTPAEPAADTVTADAASPAPPAEPPKLVGLVRGGRSGIALVHSLSGETVNLGVGDEVDGWRLTGVGRSIATFAGPSGEVSVALDFSNKAAGRAASDVPIPAPPAGSSLTPPPPR